MYGWPSLLNLLQNEGVYRQRCGGSDTCAERTVAFNLEPWRSIHIHLKLKAP